MKKIIMMSLAALLLLGCKPTPAPDGGTGGGGTGGGGTGGGPCDPTTAIVPCPDQPQMHNAVGSVDSVRS